MASVLVVNDEVDLVEVCRMVLESDGHRVETTLSGRRVLEHLRYTPPDLVLIDWVMPEVDGVTVLALMRDDPATRHIPVILMSALINAEAVAAEMGANGFLAKPFDADTLLRTVARVLSEAAQHGGAQSGVADL